MANRWNTQCNGVSHRDKEVNCCVESEYYDPSVRTSVQDFVREFMNGVTPIEVGFRGLVNDIPQPVNIYPDVCFCSNYGGRYAEEPAEVSTELASAETGAATSEARQDTDKDADKS